MESEQQLDFWGTLDGTRIVATTAGTSLTPWRAPTKAEVAKAFGDADASKGKGRRSARTALDAAESAPGRDMKARGSRTPPDARPGAAKESARIEPARHGNAFVVVRRRD